MISHPRFVKLSTSACSLSIGMSFPTILSKCLVDLWLNKEKNYVVCLFELFGRLERTGGTSAKMYNAPLNFAFFFKRPAAVASLCLLSNSCSVCITPQYCCFIDSTDLSKLSYLVLQAFFSLANTFLTLVELALTSFTFVSTFINNAIRLGEFSKCFHVRLVCPIHLECVWCLH